jgi:transporter family-2 protein
VVQQPVNANLRFEIGSAWWAGFVSYLGGTIARLLMAVVLHEPIPSKQTIHPTQWLSSTGGIFGALYIAVSIFCFPGLVPRPLLRSS